MYSVTLRFCVGWFLSVSQALYKWVWTWACVCVLRRIKDCVGNTRIKREEERVKLEKQSLWCEAKSSPMCTVTVRVCRKEEDENVVIGWDVYALRRKAKRSEIHREGIKSFSNWMPFCILVCFLYLCFSPRVSNKQVRRPTLSAWACANGRRVSRAQALTETTPCHKVLI